MGLRIEEFDANTVSEPFLRRVHEIYVDMEASFIPDDPPTPFEQHRAVWQAPGGSHRKERRWAAFDSDEMVGASHIVTWVDHADSGLLVVGVRNRSRDKGVGSELMVQALAGLEAEGRSKVIIDAPDGSRAESALKRLGLHKVFGERVSRLMISEIDWELMSQWIERASERAGDYYLLYLETPFPEDHLANWSKISEAMNTAPLEELDLEDFTMTPEKWRSVENNYEARGNQLRACVAVHRPTGVFAGMTVLIAQTYHPKLAWQDDTVVDPGHRNMGLGRLLKASLIKRFVEEFADAEQVDTGNAGSNEPMLNINIQMGFRPVLLLNAWQGEIATARAALRP